MNICFLKQYITFWACCKFLNSLCPLPWFVCVCVHVRACMCAVILQIMLFLHHRFRKKQCWSLVSFLSVCLLLSIQELLLHRTSCGTLHYSLLEKGTNAVSCALLQPGKERDGKKELRELSHMGGRDKYLDFPVTLLLR